MKLSFNSVTYVHRWSKDNQHEFTPENQPDLSQCTDVVTINIHESAHSGEDLAAVANAVLGNYQAVGKMLKTDSKPKTNEHEAEHFAAAVFPSAECIEVAFARFLLFEQTALVIVYSKRIPGSNAGAETSAWLQENGSKVEAALMAWNEIPPLDKLTSLPQIE